MNFGPRWLIVHHFVCDFVDGSSDIGGNEVDWLI